MKKRTKSVEELRDALEKAAWDEQTPDHIRRLLMQVRKRLRTLSCRALQMASRYESLEGYTEELEREKEELEALVNHLGGVQDEEGEQ